MPEEPSYSVDLEVLNKLLEERIEKAMIVDGDFELANLLRLSVQMMDVQKQLLHTIAMIIATSGYDLSKNVVENVESKVKALNAEMEMTDKLQTQVDDLVLQNHALVIALEADGNPPGPQFLLWLVDRIVHVYGENPDVDFVHALRRKAEKMQQAINLSFTKDS